MTWISQGRGEEGGGDSRRRVFRPPSLCEDHPGAVNSRRKELLMSVSQPLVAHGMAAMRTKSSTKFVPTFSFAGGGGRGDEDGKRLGAIWWMSDDISHLFS